MKYLLAFILSVTPFISDASEKESVITVTKANQEDVLKNEYLILDVYADWCNPCKNFKPVFEEVAGETKYAKFAFAKANIDGDSEISTMFKVSSVPTVLFIKNGKEVTREVGFMSKDKLQTKIENNFSK